MGEGRQQREARVRRTRWAAASRGEGRSEFAPTSRSSAFDVHNSCSDGWLTDRIRVFSGGYLQDRAVRAGVMNMRAAARVAGQREPSDGGRP